jgi:putative N6-adenine-specific DNA methylase
VAQPGTSYELFAVAAPGLEAVVEGELRSLRARTRVTDGGVEFSGDARLLYRSNLELRTASRVLLRIASFRARTFFELERHAKSIPWSRFVSPGGVIALRVTSSKSKLYHEGAIAQRLMDAATKAVKGARASTASVDDDDPDDAIAQMFVVRFLRDECVVSVDTSGALLHRRGYRQAVAKAPLRETLAAALLLSSSWRAKVPLLDPMCGSGTIAIEAALIARRIPPGMASSSRMPRPYAFQRWPEFDAKVWSDIINRARGEILARSPVAIAGSDRDAGAITSATANAQRAGVAPDVAFKKLPISAAEVPAANAWVVSNPPYGVRVGGEDQRDLYAALGRLVRERAPDGRVVLLTPDRTVAAHSAMAFEPLAETRNGGIAVQILAASPSPL